MWIAKKWTYKYEHIIEPREISFKVYPTGLTLILWTGRTTRIVMIHFVPLYYMLMGFAIGMLVRGVFNG